MSTQSCIFCQSEGNNTIFSDEHLIPQSIGGVFLISGCVCTKCNSTLGTEVDSDIWGVSDIVNAHDKLGIPYDANAVFKNHYTAKASIGDREVPVKAEWTPNGMRLHMQPHRRSDGVMMYPLGNFESSLRRNLQRKTGYLPASVDSLIAKINTAVPGQRIAHPEQSQLFVHGHPENISLQLTPKKHQVERLIAKIAFEFLYVLTNHFLLQRPAIAEPLRGLSRYATPSDALSIRRVKSDRPGFEPFHAITCYLQHGLPIIYVTFFGYIVYELLMQITPDAEYLKDIQHVMNCHDLIGFDYEQEVFPPSSGLRALLSDNRFIQIAAWGNKKDIADHPT